MLDFLSTKAIFEKVEKLLCERGWTIYELAKKSGLSKTTIYNWRERNTSPTLSVLNSVCMAFGITIIDFLLDNDTVIYPTKEKREVLDLWKTLSNEQKDSILSIMKNFNR